MNTSEVRARYLSFFEKRGHAIIPSAPLVPENDSTTLFTSSGMQPLVPYLLGEKHPKGTRLVNSQMCFRAEDIDEVGDNRHTTFFEMLGNWSLGDYFKKEQLPWIFEFLTSKEEGLGLDPKKIFVTVFSGDKENGMGADTESVEIWKTLFAEKGVDAKLVEIETEERGGETGMQDGRIFAYGATKNWWSRSGIPSKMPKGEIGGPDSEIFYDFGTPHDIKFGKECHPNCDCGRFVEIGNSVFMQYIKKEDGTFAELPKKNVDFGGGLERITATTNMNPDIFLVDVFKNSREVLAKHSAKKYGEDETVTRSFRIILDHIRSATFMLASGIVPSNTEQGYILRRLIRRAIAESDFIGIKNTVLADVADGYSEVYANTYSFIQKNIYRIKKELTNEEEKFRKTLTQGLKEFKKISQSGSISGKSAFILFTSYGFPIEMTEELAREQGMSIDRSSFDALMLEHKERSRVGAAQKFKGGLADTDKETTMLHTCTHLMLSGLRKYLGEEVHQAGSNITAERLRFDFTYPEKVSREILDEVEKYVNDAIERKCDVELLQISKEQAKKDGVVGSFWEKYPDIVNVYTIKTDDGTVYSKELCGGPHVKNLNEILETGKHFKITKETSSSAGVRRVKAVLK